MNPDHKAVPNMASVSFSIFSRPWKTQSLAELGELVHTVGADPYLAR
jgi:hypothetical protein